MKKYLRIIYNHANPLRFILAKLLCISKLNRFSKIERGSYRLHFHPAALSLNLWVNRLDRKAEEAFLQSLLEPGDFVIDVGANIGTVSLAIASRVGAKGKVYSFEPHPKIYSFLVDNINLNGFKQIIPHNKALGSKAGTVYLSDHSDDSQNTVESSGHISVKLDTLDNVVPEEPIKLIKIDVEGYEGEVLMGASNILRRTAMVYLECISALLLKRGCSEEKLVQLLNTAGFEVFSNVSGVWERNKIGDQPKKMLLCRKTNI